MAQAESHFRVAQSAMTAERVVGVPIAASASASQRLVSLDFLRGFTMFWIVGGSELVAAIAGCIQPVWADSINAQLSHARWNGFTVYDLIMPLFLFVVGASMPLAFASRIGPGRPLQPLYWRIARRVALLWSFGIVFQYMKQLGDGDTFSLELYSNTLQAIAVGYLVTSLALLHLRVPGQVVLLVSLVIGYWTLLVFVPFGGHPAGTLEQKANFARYIDVSLLGDYRRDHHFTWVATSLGFTASVLLGAMAGQLLRARLSVPRRLVYLVLLGCSSLLGGWIWSYSHPFNRHLWTSSMILWSGGWSFLLLAFFYLVMDVAKVRAWAYPFLVIGANALLAYMLDIFFYWVLDRIWADVLPVGLSAAYTSLVTSAYEVALLWLILWWLYRRGLFLRA